MGFLDNLLNRNPTAEWREQRGLQLVLDMDNESFCGVNIDDPVSRLEKFGPAENAKAARYGAYDYPSRAFSISTEQGRVVEFDIHYYDHEMYKGTFRARGRDFTKPMKEAELVAAIGQPQERNVDQEEGLELVQLEYVRSRSIWHFEFDGAGVLETIWVGKND